MDTAVKVWTLNAAETMQRRARQLIGQEKLSFAKLQRDGADIGDEIKNSYGEYRELLTLNLGFRRVAFYEERGELRRAAALRLRLPVSGKPCTPETKPKGTCTLSELCSDGSWANQRPHDPLERLWHSGAAPARPCGQPEPRSTPPRRA